MSDFPRVLTQVWQMDSADLCVVGVHLGYNWTQVCQEVNKAEFYAQDGEGSFTHDKGEPTGSEILDDIMNAIYAAWSRVTSISINN